MLRGKSPAERQSGACGDSRQGDGRASADAADRPESLADLGPDYAAAFDRIFPDLASQYRVALYPFFLDGVAADPKLNQQDGLHPNPEGVKIIVERILPSVEALLGKPKS